jgi:hypothetical protein
MVLAVEAHLSPWKLALLAGIRGEEAPGNAGSSSLC